MPLSTGQPRGKVGFSCFAFEGGVAEPGSNSPRETQLGRVNAGVGIQIAAFTPCALGSQLAGY